MRLKLTAGLFVSVALIFALTLSAYGEQSSVTDSTYGQDGQPSVIDQVYNGGDSSTTVTPRPTPPIGSGITVYVNYEPLISDVPPTVIDGCTIVPLRAFIEALNVEAQWDESTKTITAARENSTLEPTIDQNQENAEFTNQGHLNTVKLTIDQTKAYVNNKEVTMGVPAQLINGRAMVPLRFISESLGTEVNWDKTTQVITINLLTI
ncbi:copper amine oxidase N-terminal domain-containing protein [Desulfoscipio gibsoniae]|uniref:Copper amine oxidase family protein n=1 Tax=Desulfoscipio gibsoniae DSM 7213 TaxID=767817 RepID=R4KF37_9FIRM|nr:copper amine oxidase N-terminal domain-containing protein [Desulfoscipio gibsoniae]AGL01204.1 copper amine oxidase family protein [Desulfoscipio gibsoniae DSM 7213]